MVHLLGKLIFLLKIMILSFKIILFTVHHNLMIAWVSWGEETLFHDEKLYYLQSMPFTCAQQTKKVLGINEWKDFHHY